MIGVLLLGAMAVAPRLSTARQAAAFEVQMRRVETLVQLARILTEEQLPLQLQATGRTFGVDSSVMSSLLGYDPAVRSLETARATDTFIAANSSDALVRETGVKVKEIRDRVAAKSISEAELYSGFRGIVERLIGVWVEEGAEVNNISGRGADEMRMALEAVRAAVAFSNNINEQYTVLFSLVTVDKSDTQRNRKLQNELLELFTREDVNHGQLVQFARKRSELVEKVVQGEHAETVRSMIQLMVENKVDVTGLGALRLVPLVQAGTDRALDIEELVAIVLADALEQSSTLRTNARNDLALAVAASLLVGLASFLFAGIVSRRLSASLAAVSKKAKQIANGDLSFDATDAAGPLEIVTMHQVMDDLVQNLRIVQRQSTALANGSLDDEALSLPAPGPLGAALQASVQRLARSMREREELQEQLSHQATHDPLTGLPNRAAAVFTIEQALARSHRSDTNMAVFFVDLDDSRSTFT
jgi:hypothetical protein